MRYAPAESTPACLVATPIGAARLDADRRLVDSGPVNLYQFYGDDFRSNAQRVLESWTNLFEVAKEITTDLAHLFAR